MNHSKQTVFSALVLFASLSTLAFSCKLNTDCTCFGLANCCCGSNGLCYEDPIDEKDYCQEARDCNFNHDCPQGEKEMVCEYGVCDVVRGYNFLPLLIFFAIAVITLLCCCVIFTVLKKRQEEKKTQEQIGINLV